MSTIRAPHTTDVPHTIQPYIASLLREHDLVIVSPYMGVGQFAPFGKRVLVDVTNYMGIKLVKGDYTKRLQRMCRKAGVGVWKGGAE